MFLHFVIGYSAVSYFAEVLFYNNWKGCFSTIYTNCNLEVETVQRSLDVVKSTLSQSSDLTTLYLGFSTVHTDSC